jgi:hypothetical protein
MTPETAAAIICRLFKRLPIPRHVKTVCKSIGGLATTICERKWKKSGPRYRSILITASLGPSGSKQFKCLKKAVLARASYVNSDAYRAPRIRSWTWGTVSPLPVDWTDYVNQIQDYISGVRRRGTDRSLITRLWAQMVAHTRVIKIDLPPPEWESPRAFFEWWMEHIRQSEGTCYVSGTKLQFDPSSPFCVSPERIDCTQGYSPTNLVAILRLFNSCPTGPSILEGVGSAQWTPAKFQSVPALRIAADNPAENVWLDREISICEYYLTIPYRRSEEKRESLLWKFLARVTVKRAKTSLWAQRGRHMDFTISKKWLLNKVKTTRLRCEYSNIRMSILPKRNWVCSLERVNDDVGYTEENTILVCHEFNHGNAKWNKELVQHFWPIDITSIPDVTSTLVEKHPVKRPFFPVSASPDADNFSVRL